jgi:hypothetical protein
MANEVRTYIEVKSDKNETFKKLQELLGDADYKEMGHTMWLYNQLYDFPNDNEEYDRGDYTEKIGAKWCYVDDMDADEGVFTMTTVSAWYYCEGAIRRLQEILQEVDEEVCIAFTYEDESMDPIGGGACYKGELFTYEDSLEWPNYDDYEEESDYDSALEEMYDSVYQICEELKNEAMVDVYEEVNGYEEIEASQDEEE